MDGDAASSPAGRRRLEYQEVERVGFGSDDLPKRDADCLRAAARKWAKSASLVLGSFSSPSLTPDDAWTCSSLCFLHEECHLSLIHISEPTRLESKSRFAS